MKEIKSREGEQFNIIGAEMKIKVIKKYKILTFYNH